MMKLIFYEPLRVDFFPQLFEKFIFLESKENKFIYIKKEEE